MLPSKAPPRFSWISQQVTDKHEKKDEDTKGNSRTMQGPIYSRIVFVIKIVQLQGIYTTLPFPNIQITH